MKRFLFVLSALWIVFSIPAADNGTLARTMDATLLVAEPEKAAESVCAWAEERGGHFLVRSSDMVILRFPTDDIGAFRIFIEDLSEDIVDLSIQACDKSEEMLSLESGIQARQEILEENLKFIDGADVRGTLAIEQEVMKLLKEIESMKGRLKKLRVDIRMARAGVYFIFRDKSLPSDIPSSFDWINRVDFYRFLREEF